jgi:hypothetical protein
MILLFVLFKKLFLCSQWIGCPNARATISVKRLGELDGKPFLEAAKRKVSAEVNAKAATKRQLFEEAKVKALLWCTQWDEYLRDPDWHPFKILTDKEGNSKVQYNDFHNFNCDCNFKLKLIFFAI